MVDQSELQSARSSLTSDEFIRYVLVVGAGWVGRQIVGQLAAYGLKVVWYDVDSKSTRAGFEWLQTNLPILIRDGFYPSDAATQVSSIECIESLDSLARPLDLAVESVTEQISVKRRVLAELSRCVSPETIIASNSSYFTPSVLERYVETPERYVHFHFHVPVWRTRLVDIAAGPKTSAVVIAKLEELARRIEQYPLTQLIENSGYVFNAMLKAVIQSALRLAHKGVSTPEQIDMAWKKVMGMPIGPFGMMDQVGLDLVYQTMATARFVDGAEAWQPLMELIEPYLSQGKLGAKTGEGFFKYEEQ